MYTLAFWILELVLVKIPNSNSIQPLVCLIYRLSGCTYLPHCTLSLSTLSLATAKDDIVFPTAEYQTFLCLLPIYPPRRLPTILFLLLYNLPLQPAYRMY